MKKSFFGYNKKEVEDKISSYEAQTEMLSKRLARQDEEIKELMYMFGGFSSVEAKLKSSARVISSLADQLNDNGEMARTLDSAQTDLATISANSEELVLLSDEASSKMQVIREVSDELRVISGETRSAVTIINEVLGSPRLQEICDKLDDTANKLSSIEEHDATDVLDKITVKMGTNLGLQHAMRARLEESVAHASERLSGEEFAQLQTAINNLLQIASQAGRLSNSGLADIERGNVTNYLEDRGDVITNEENVVPVADPDFVIDNPNGVTAYAPEVEYEEE